MNVQASPLRVLVSQKKSTLHAYTSSKSVPRKVVSSAVDLRNLSDRWVFAGVLLYWVYLNDDEQWSEMLRRRSLKA
jgi:hypothetical protein